MNIMIQCILRIEGAMRNAPPIHSRRSEVTGTRHRIENYHGWDASANTPTNPTVMQFASGRYGGSSHSRQYITMAFPPNGSNWDI